MTPGMPDARAEPAARPAESDPGPGLRARIRASVQIARPGFWATSAWFYLLPLGGRDVLDSAPFWLGLLYVTFPLGHLLYGWNDLFDAETDRANPRKGTYLFGARPGPAQRRRLPLELALVQLPFVIAFVWLEGARMLAWFGALAAACAAYNWPRWGLKNHPVADLLNQAGYLLVFVLSSWLNGVPQLARAGFAFGLLFAMHSHLLGQIMDVEPDREAGRRTTAVAIGVVAAKWVLVALLVLEAAIVGLAYGDAWIAAGLAAGAAWFALDAAFAFRGRPYGGSTMRAFLLGWNVVAVATMGWIWQRATFAPA